MKNIDSLMTAAAAVLLAGIMVFGTPAAAAEEAAAEDTVVQDAAVGDAAAGDAAPEHAAAKIVVLDPGHQGSWVDMSAPEPMAPGSSETKPKATTGTTGLYSGVHEYELNLDIALLLKEELAGRGYEVIMTREDHDTAISNAERAQLANNAGADAVIRIHANGLDDHSVSGALAMVPGESNPYVGDLSAASYRLADNILQKYCEKTGFASLGVMYEDTMTGINWSRVPVMILEMGFMTNEGDDLAMQDPDMQKRMAEGIADGVDGYFSE